VQFLSLVQKEKMFFRRIPNRYRKANEIHTT
jgi:hypothetical protein